MTAVLGYHQNTKHSFHRFARSPGHLDWPAQPDPFRRYDGAPLISLPQAALRPDVPYSVLFAGGAAPAPMDVSAIGEFLRCAMGLSAWKQYQASRWALRVNPSSGNLHPTECYVVWGGRVCHYSPRDHALELRAGLEHPSARGAAAAAVPFDPGEARRSDRDGDGYADVFVVGLTSIPWREAWKYGERAFRYCQHDVGHAIGALRFSAALLGWQVSLLDVSDDDIGALLGTSRDDDYRDAEREEPECLLLVTAEAHPASLGLSSLVGAARNATWSGRANVLSRSHVEWAAIDEVARATRRGDVHRVTPAEAASGPRAGAAVDADSGIRARRIIVQRRSALGFDATSSLPAERFIEMLRRLNPGSPPWDAIDWPPFVHLALFVHRVDGLVPGLYAWLRDPAAVDELRAAMRPEFLWEPVTARNADERHDLDLASNLYLLVPTDVRFAANRLSCDQDIASDGFFGLGMIARLEPTLRERGDWFYRRLFWECGLIGQVLYLEAEAAGARATGIGCFYDDPVHEALGLSGMTWQSLYHFSMGVPVDDGRLTTESGYGGDW